MPGAPHRDLWVEADHFHAEREHSIGDFDADGAEADNAKRAAWEFEAKELFLAGLNFFLQIIAGVLQAPDIFPCGTDISRREQQARNCQFFYRIRVGTRRIEHRNASHAQLFNWNVVHSRTRSTDCDDGFRNIHVMHVV